MNALQIVKTTVQDHTDIQIKGDLLSLDALQLKDQLKKLVESSPSLTIDLREPDKIDLTGFNTMIITKAQGLKMKKKCRIIVAEKSGIQDYIRLTGFHHLFENSCKTD